MDSMKIIQYLKYLKDNAYWMYQFNYGQTIKFTPDFWLQKADIERFISNSAFSDYVLRREIMCRMTQETENPASHLAEILYEIRKESLEDVKGLGARELHDVLERVNDINQLLTILKFHFSAHYIEHLYHFPKKVGDLKSFSLYDGKGAWNFLPNSVIQRRINHPELYPDQAISCLAKINKYNYYSVEEFLEILWQKSVEWDVYFTAEGFSTFFEVVERYAVECISYEEMTSQGKRIAVSLVYKLDTRHEAVKVKFFFDEYEDGTYRILGYLINFLCDPDGPDFIDLSDKIDHFSIPQDMFNRKFDKLPESEFTAKYVLLFDKW